MPPFSKKLPSFACAALLLTTAATLRAQDFYLHDGDRVAFYGDSITAQRFYTRDVQDFAETRYPTLQATWHNAGVPGDKVTGGYAGDAATRVARDVSPFDPTVITVMLGMNDGDYVPPDPKIFADYQSGYEKLLDLLRASAPHARMTLVENTPYDEITHGTEFAGYMATTEQNARATPALGEREHLPVVDDYSPVKDLLERAKAADPSFASLLETDRIHPAEPLHWIMAEAIMQSWHVDPVVSAVTLSAPSLTATQSQRTVVTGIAGSATGLSWDQQDQALPLPFNFENALMNFVIRVSDLAAWDQETLRIDGLRPGNYALTIDDRKVSTFSAAQLASGVNLALLPTPMWDEARDYDAALGRRSQLEDADFILLAETKVSDLATASRILREGESQFEQKARAALHIPLHHYRLAPAS
ncbi:MAG TPA: SGNH/GDSL hydrolase family protein [Acidobacteriaceae bacterium]|jgi:lysophospholipase L1-like esterase|nr:SGNH/GDSL hydrolase family protein [Acidobacteriaceae bacterium]